MSDSYPSAPKNLRSLRDRLMHLSRREGVVFGRLQQHLGVLVVSQMMSTLSDEQGRPNLLIKAGTSLELRRGITRSRASRDLDAVTRGSPSSRPVRSPFRPGPPARNCLRWFTR